MNQFSSDELTEILYYLELARVCIMRNMETDTVDNFMFEPLNKIIEKVRKAIVEK